MTQPASNFTISGFILVVSLLTSTLSPLCGQARVDSIELNKVNIYSSAGIRDLVKLHVGINESRNAITGYRVQLYSGSNRTKAQEIRMDFSRMYPSRAVYLQYSQPNFRVRAGDFRTRLEAVKFHTALNTHFAASFVVKDDIMIIP
jgi:hypothetical protein